MSNVSFHVGEVVWAKIRGYPHWPAIITGIEDDNKEKKYAVSFIGDNTHASLAKKYLVKFEKGLKLYANTKKKNLLESIEKAKEIYYNKNGTNNNLNNLNHFNRRAEIFRRRANHIVEVLANYFLIQNSNGDNLDNIINHIMLHDTNKYGNPPAAKKAVESLKKYKINAKKIK